MARPSIPDFLRADHYILCHGNQALVKGYWYEGTGPHNSDDLAIKLESGKTYLTIPGDNSHVQPLPPHNAPPWLKPDVPIIYNDDSGQKKSTVVSTVWGLRGKDDKPEDTKTLINGCLVYEEGNVSLDLSKYFDSYAGLPEEVKTEIWKKHKRVHELEIKEALLTQKWVLYAGEEKQEVVGTDIPLDRPCKTMPEKLSKQYDKPAFIYTQDDFEPEGMQ